MIRSRFRGVGARALLAVAVVAGLAWQLPDVVLKRQELNGVSVDVRPMKTDDAVRLEAQIYYEELSDEDTKQYGTRFIIHVPEDSKLALGDSRAKPPIPGGTSLISLRDDRSYELIAYWDEAEGLAYIHLTEIAQNPTDPGEKHEALVTSSSGEFNEITPFSPPTVEDVLSGSADPTKKRIRVTSHNRGMDIGFTLEDE